MDNEIISCIKCKTKNPISNLNCTTCGFKLQKSVPILKSKDFTASESLHSSKLTVKVKEIENVRSGDANPFGIPSDDLITTHKNTVLYEHQPIDNNLPSCKVCSYLLSNFSQICPNCGYSGNSNIPEDIGRSESKHDEYKVKPDNFISKEDADSVDFVSDSVLNQSETKTERQDAKDSIFSINNNLTVKEINIHQNQQPDIHIKKNIVVSPVRFEPILLNSKDDNDMKPINITEERFIINREIVDKNDNTISTDIHVMLQKNQGKWELYNHASNKAVFIQVIEPYTLKNGDVIMLGGEKFFTFIDETDENI